MKFLVDANLSPRLALSLNEAGHDVVHVADLGLGRATGLEILELADRDGRVVVSAGTDFGTLLAIGNRGRPSVLVQQLFSPRRTQQLTAWLQIEPAGCSGGARHRIGRRGRRRPHRHSFPTNEPTAR